MDVVILFSCSQLFHYNNVQWQCFTYVYQVESKTMVLVKEYSQYNFRIILDLFLAHPSSILSVSANTHTCVYVCVWPFINIYCSWRKNWQVPWQARILMRHQKVSDDLHRWSVCTVPPEGLHYSLATFVDCNGPASPFMVFQHHQISQGVCKQVNG